MKTAERRDRLLHLLHRRSTTVPAVARAFGVSERTVYRDLTALRDAGHAVVATPGRGGGVRIAPDSRPRAVHFEVAEIVGLALSVALMKATPHTPFVASAEAALDRARRALSPERRRAIERLERRILVGAPASERVRGTLGDVEPALLPVFERCFTEQRELRFGYRDASGGASTRRIECIALVLHTPVAYVLAWDLEKDVSRLFRMDRITAPVCGRPLREVHTLSEAKAEGGDPTDRWRRRPLGPHPV